MLENDPETKMLAAQGAMILTVIGVRILENKFNKIPFSHKPLVDYYKNCHFPFCTCQLAVASLGPNLARIIEFIACNNVSEMVEHQISMLPAKIPFEIQNFDKNPNDFGDGGSPFIRLIVDNLDRHMPDIIDLTFYHTNNSWYLRKNRNNFKYICKFDELFEICYINGKKRVELSSSALNKAIDVLEK